jgi:choline dehydrogenase-like flavoprotein
MPEIPHLRGGDDATVARLEAMLGLLGPVAVRAAKAGLWAAEAWPISRFGRPMSLLARDERERAILAWSESGSRHERWLLRAILTPLKSAHFDAPELREEVGCKGGVDTRTRHAESGRWTQQMIDGRHAAEDMDLSCEVVVIGTGAGGAAAAYELAKRGRAVLLLESGHYHARDSFRGNPTEASRHLYLGLGATIALGNVAAPVLAGRGVGGSTTINSGTCYRAPEQTLARWAERYGLTMLSADKLAPYFARVEAMLGVAEAPREHLGGSARVVARGAKALGLSHGPLMRNAPGCDGQGVCCFGCPTGAKRSTDVSYIPAALERGAQLVTGAHVQRVVVRGGRARGVTARLASGKKLTVRAEAVVVAGGALLTPLLLGRSGLCASSGWLGKNLSIHPATKVMALFDERIDPSRGIPQSYAIDEYAKDGLMFEGASTPLDVTALSVPLVGRAFMDVMSRYANLATFGMMIQDKSRGEVRRGPGGQPLIRYDMGKEDVARMQRGIEILCEVFLRAGAKRVLPMVHGMDELSSDAGLAALRKMRLEAGDFEVTAYHPLGTCRMGTDPRRSCVGPDGEAHDVMGLYVADGSAVPSSLGANPQMTIMALALRTAEALDARLDRLAAGAPSQDEKPRARIGFDETMSGTMRLVDAPQPVRPLSFTLRARGHDLGRFAKTGEVRIDGELLAEGFGARCPVEGTLTMDPLWKRRIRYAFGFTADDGRRLSFFGQKSIRLGALGRSMTYLPGQITDERGHLLAEAEVTFDVARDLVTFVKSWRLGR